MDSHGKSGDRAREGSQGRDCKEGNPLEKDLKLLAKATQPPPPHVVVPPREESKLVVRLGKASITNPLTKTSTVTSM
jgi:hypothetical protein